MRAFLASVLLWLWAAMPGAAEDRKADLAALFDLLKMDETIAIMREEGLSYGRSMSDGYLGEPAGPAWVAEVERIYDAERMGQLVREEMAKSLEGVDLAGMRAFFDTAEGQMILQLELDARRALMDEAIEEEAMARYAAETDTRLASQVEGIISDSDLIERNVVSSLNSEIMFYRGLAQGGYYEGSETDILRDVWAQEEAIREDTKAWIGGFLMLAYSPLEPKVLEGYAEFYRSEPGRDLNRALFDGFNRMFDELSFLMGAAIAGFAAGEKL